MPRDVTGIDHWLRRIEASPLSIASFFANHNVPFSQSQYFRYKARRRAGAGTLRSKRGRSQKIGREEELYLKGCLAGGSELSPQRLRQMLQDELNSEVSLATIRRAINRLYPRRPRRRAGRPRTKSSPVVVNSLGGFELIVAIAYFTKWTNRTGDIIARAVRELKGKVPRPPRRARRDSEGRDGDGHFTGQYNRRKDVRKNRFASISDKRGNKNWDSMDIASDQVKTLSRKSLAILSLPIVTANGSVRNVNLAPGQALGHLCGFNYKQTTINQFLSELKYAGLSEQLLQELPRFWQTVWGADVSNIPGPVLCYYIDGNTKAVWSSKRVKKNKVTMLGRVMGCLEQVFIHDGLGRPVYFETYSGHAPVGEYVLGLFKKIEATILEVPRSRTQVCRAIVMDAASNSVKSLRAFAAQDVYHYITTLDDNQWSQRKVRNAGYPIRYRHGNNATLRDVEFEMADSKDDGFMIVVRAIKINWDNGRQTVLLTNLPKTMVDASEVVYAYFRRWPAQESMFRAMKATVSLHRVSGYGKKEVPNERAKKRFAELEVKKARLEQELAEPLLAIAEHDKALAKLITQDRLLRRKTTIEEGKRDIPIAIRARYIACVKRIKQHEKAKDQIDKAHAKAFRKHRRVQREWLRLKGKDTVYQMDVELDQILTYFRASLAHLCAYFIKNFLGGEPISMVTLVQGILLLQAQVEESAHERKITLRANRKDRKMMDRLRQAINKLNDLNIRGNGARVYRFVLA